MALKFKSKLPVWTAVPFMAFPLHLALFKHFVKNLRSEVASFIVAVVPNLLLTELSSDAPLTHKRGRVNRDWTVLISPTPVLKKLPPLKYSSGN